MEPHKLTYSVELSKRNGLFTSLTITESRIASLVGRTARDHRFCTAVLLVAVFTLPSASRVINVTINSAVSVAFVESKQRNCVGENRNTAGQVDKSK